MKKIAIYVCGDVADRCTANGCLRSFNEKTDSFKVYEEEGAMLVAFNTCNGCDKDPVESLDLKIEKLLKAGTERVHLSTCIRGRCDHYETFAHKLSDHFDVVGYTHGSAEGKKDNTVNLDKR